jgi:dihydropteroate synthase
VRSYDFKTASGTLEIGPETLIMGVLNCTPDSFSDGGEHNTVDKAVDRALEMIDQGSGLIDIGGESTRPGADKVSADEELARVIPVISTIREESDIPISIDTTKAAVAEEAIFAGADIINDISAFKMDPDMKGVAIRTGAGCMLMHMRGTPQTMQQFCEYDDLIADIKTYFTEIIEDLVQAGIDRSSLIIDPGIGFSKTADQNLQLINELDSFLDFNLPILLGTSRKSFIGKTLGKNDPADRIWGTAASNAVGIVKGASVVRVHDIAEMADVVRLTDAILNS